MRRSPSYLRGRPLHFIHEYDDRGRVVRSWQTSEWTAEDRALMLAHAMYLKTLCPGCGHPKDKAWHWDNDGGRYEVTRTYQCHPCTTLARTAEGPEAKPVQYHRVEYMRDEQATPLPPFLVEGPDQTVIDEAMGGAL